MVGHIQFQNCIFFTNNYLGNKAVNGDKKSLSLRAMTEWVLNYKKFTLAAETGSALVRTLLSFGSLFEDLLGEGCDFVLTSRFQSNLLERKFGQCW